jgi:hypothetical protein
VEVTIVTWAPRAEVIFTLPWAVFRIHDLFDFVRSIIFRIMFIVSNDVFIGIVIIVSGASRRFRVVHSCDRSSVGRFELRHSCELVIHGGKIGSRSKSRVNGGGGSVVVIITVIIGSVVIIITVSSRRNTIVIVIIGGVRRVIIVVVVVGIVIRSVGVDEGGTGTIHERQTNGAVVAACQGMDTVNDIGGNG